MTKRPLYAGLAIAVSFWGQSVAAGTLQDTRPACAACVAVAIHPAQALLLPDQLHGLTIMLRLSPDMTLDLGAGIAAIRERGGIPAVLASALMESIPGGAEYGAKLRLTDIRAAVGGDVLIALEEPSADNATPFLAGIAAYADVLVSRDAERFEAGKRVWQLLPSATVTRALEATRAGDAERWVVVAPADALDAKRGLSELASAAAPDPAAFREEVEVRADRRLTAEEIVARHQAAVRRQAAKVTHVISSGVLSLTFEAPGFPAPVTVTSETTVYQRPGRTELEQRTIRVNGVDFSGRGVPRLPIIEPERVSAPPLVITLSTQYRYARLPDDTVNGTRCHVVSFEPLTARTSLFRGRAWIAVDSYAAVRISGAQTRLKGAIVSSEQVDDFREFLPGVWSLARSEVRQLYEGAGHRTPIQRVLRVDGVLVNPPDFESRLNAAYASSSVMLRDTAEGYRYLQRRSVPDTRKAGGGGEPGAGDATRLAVETADRASRVRTLIAGVIIDPNISRPLPFAGVSYVDFDLGGTGAQLNAFFGGTYGQLAFSVPSLSGSRWQLAGRAFGIASSYNDRSFRGGREIYEENLRQTPAHGSVWLLRPVSPRVAIRIGYEFDYTRLRRAPETSGDFGVPPDQLVHGLRLAVDGQRRGWSGSLWWNPARRTGWRTWGRANGEYQPGHGDFQRVGATLARSAALAPQLVTRVETAVMTGWDLDRFSQYSFGTFDNRLRGYPSALVRYDRGAVARGAVAWSVAKFVRLDGFLDTAWVRDRGYGVRYRNYTGIGTAVEAPAPFGILAAVEWGYGFRGVQSDGGQGTHVVRISGLKVF